jgi:Cu-Zn family superoxide dismutase
MRYLYLSLCSMLVLMGCASSYRGPASSAQLQPSSGSQVSGKINFSQHTHGIVKVSGQVSGLKPNAEHGFHVHEVGDCSSADGSSAGAHFNPLGKPHGTHSSPNSHAGDFPNLVANANGMAIVQFETGRIQLGAGVVDVTGRSIVVHAQPDDLHSQPAGNAGARIACGVIRRQ